MEKIFHVELLEEKEGYRKHYYFGGLSAIYDLLPYSILGVKLESLWANHDFDKGPYINKQVVIRKGELHRKKGNRGRKKE